MTISGRGKSGDLGEIAAIQAATPKATQWDVAGYLPYQILVAVSGGRIAGFLVKRPADDRECGLLNLAVAPAYRRQGIGRGLGRALLSSRRGAIFLEVRESNQASRRLS